MPSVPHPHEAVEYLHRGMAVECSTIDILLTLLRHSATILLMPISRRLPEHGAFLVQYAIHLTARKIEQRESPVYYCTLPAVQALHVAEQGRIIFPLREQGPTPLVTARARALTATLQTSLISALQTDVRVNQVLAPARYRLPDAWVWNSEASLSGTGISFQQDRWVFHHTHA